ncbi:MAG: hypothetical protein ACOYJA_13120, partial [Christensenellales bacterium]
QALELLEAQAQVDAYQAYVRNALMISPELTAQQLVRDPDFQRQIKQRFGDISALQYTHNTALTRGQKALQQVYRPGDEQAWERQLRSDQARQYAQMVASGESSRQREAKQWQKDVQESMDRRARELDAQYLHDYGMLDTLKMGEIVAGVENANTAELDWKKQENTLKNLQEQSDRADAIAHGQGDPSAGKNLAMDGAGYGTETYDPTKAYYTINFNKAGNRTGNAARYLEGRGGLYNQGTYLFEGKTLDENLAGPYAGWSYEQLPEGVIKQIELERLYADDDNGVNTGWYGAQAALARNWAGFLLGTERFLTDTVELTLKVQNFVNPYVRLGRAAWDHLHIGELLPEEYREMTFNGVFPADIIPLMLEKYQQDLLNMTPEGYEHTTEAVTEGWSILRDYAISYGLGKAVTALSTAARGTRAAQSTLTSLAEVSGGAVPEWTAAGARLTNELAPVGSRIGAMTAKAPNWTNWLADRLLNPRFVNKAYSQMVDWSDGYYDALYRGQSEREAQQAAKQNMLIGSLVEDGIDWAAQRLSTLRFGRRSRLSAQNGGQLALEGTRAIQPWTPNPAQTALALRQTTSRGAENLYRAAGIERWQLLREHANEIAKIRAKNRIMDLLDQLRQRFDPEQQEE